jgi:hypothetical protein
MKEFIDVMRRQVQSRVWVWGLGFGVWGLGKEFIELMRRQVQFRIWV